jgi:hypothetical protein
MSESDRHSRQATISHAVAVKPGFPPQAGPPEGSRLTSSHIHPRQRFVNEMKKKSIYALSSHRLLRLSLCV